MRKIRNQKHSKDAFYYSASMMLERTSFYGLRILILFHMTGEVLQMDRTEALNIFGWFLSSLLLSQIIGAFLGDLVIGNKKIAFIGGLIQALGAFSLCIPATTGLYLGLFLVALGSGFYTPNLISNFGKSYLNKTKLLDSGFTILYLVINLGAFFGISLLGYLGERFSYNLGFLTAGLLMLFSLIPLLIAKDRIEDNQLRKEFPIGKRVLNIAITLISVGLFWGIYEISNIRILDLQSQFNDISAFGISEGIWSSLHSILILPIGIIAIIIWTNFYSSQFFKLMFGFIFGGISIGILLLIPEVPTENYAIYYVLSLVFLGISEIYIAPVIHSILTQYSNPKYLAILISLAFLPNRLIALGFGLFNDRFYENPTLGLKFGLIAMIVIGIGLFGYVLRNKKLPSTLYNRNNG